LGQRDYDQLWNAGGRGGLSAINEREDEEGQVEERGGLDLWEKRVEGIIGAKEATAAGAEGGEDGEGGLKAEVK
jgi:hypothetical protein